MGGNQDGAGSYEIAAAALGLLTATCHDGDQFGEVTVDYLSAMGNDTGKVIRLATGMTALARVLIGMRRSETGASYDETLGDLGRRVQKLLSSSG
jgi:sugar/nucleoside kinase (ribokinase family)